jgi:hypothetical protein
MVYNKKIIVIGFVVLIILVFTPIAQAGFFNDFKSKENLLQIEISKYNSDGSIDNNIVTLPNNVINNLKNEFLSAKTVEEQLAILKDYQLISEDVESEDLENEMYKRAEILGLNEEIQPEKSGIGLPILLKFFNRINIVYMGGISLDIGLKFIIRFINLLPFINLPTIDFVDICGGLFGITSTDGLFSNNTLITFPGVIGMIGFIGYRIKFPVLFHTYTGFSAVTFGLGFGLKIKG